MRNCTDTDRRIDGQPNTDSNTGRQKHGQTNS